MSFKRALDSICGNYLILCEMTHDNKKTSTTPSCKGIRREGKTALTKKTKRHLDYDVMMASQLKHLIHLLKTIQGVAKFLFGTLIIMTNRSILYIQG